MPPQAHWSPTAIAFAQHQFSHVANFWKQGRQASFRLEALPGGKAEINLTFQLPNASEVIPPPFHVSPVPAPQRPIPPLFPKGRFPQQSSHSPPKVISRREKKNYRHSVLHQAALAAPSLPPPKSGSLRQAAEACVQHLQAKALQVSAQSVKKRPLSTSPTALLSPSNQSPLAQRIRSDIKICESEIESPEKELLRSSPCPEKSPCPMSPYSKGFPSPAPLVFTPSKVQCSNCDGDMTHDHQCGVLEPESVVEEHPPPLPLCHYCCHLGSGDNPIHYYLQCLCPDKVCSCKCYCNEKQLEHRKLHYPEGFSGPMVPVDPEDRPQAKIVAEKRIRQWPIWPCEGCVEPP